MKWYIIFREGDFPVSVHLSDEKAKNELESLKKRYPSLKFWIDEVEK